jgi:hypothetical protein
MPPPRPLLLGEVTDAPDLTTQEIIPQFMVQYGTGIDLFFNEESPVGYKNNATILLGDQKKN